MFLLAVNVASGAAVRYVDQNSRGGPCSDARTPAQAVSSSTPWCTLGRSLTSAAAGDTVVVRAADYPRFDVRGFHRAADVSFVAFAGERPKLKDVELTDSDHLVFRGFEINLAWVQRCSQLTFRENQVTSSGLFAFYSNHLTFVQNALHDTNEGIIFRFSTDVVVQGNDFRRIPLPTRAEGGDGIQAAGVQHVLITGNTFDQLRSSGHVDAIEFGRNNDDVTISNNRFHDTRGVIVVPGDGVAKAVNTRWLIANNDMTHVRQWGLHLLNFTGVRIVNNTVWDAGSSGLGLFGATRGAVLLNNIVSKLDAQPVMIGTEDHNLIAAGYRRGAHDVTKAPVFMSPATLDFRLKPRSPGIDAGTSEGAPATDLNGMPRADALDVPNTGAGATPYVDMGAYEFQPPPAH